MPFAPFVIVTATTEVIRDRSRVRLNEAYTDALAAAGLVPLILPPIDPIVAIASLTDSGSTALWMSRHDCGCPIFALTPKVATQRKMALYRNVSSFLMKQSTDRDAVLREAEDLLVERGQVQKGDLIVLTVGEPMGKSGGTNTMKIVRVGEHRA